MKKIYIIFGVSIVLLFGSTYLIFNNHVEAAKLLINEKNKSNKKKFINSKSTFLIKFYENFPKYEHLFNDYFKPEKAKYNKDTLVSFFIYNKKLSILNYDNSYYDCLVSKCENEIEKIKVDKEINQKLDQIKRTYGEKSLSWFKKIGKINFLNTLETNEDCNSFFENNAKISINNTAFLEFKEFLKKVKSDEKINKRISDKSISKFNSLVKKAKYSFTNSGQEILDSEIKANNFITEKTVNFTYKGDVLGDIDYSFTIKEFENGKFNSILEKIYLKQYKNNSLSSGSKPYSYCFGSNNSCSDFGCSQIKVKTPYNSDVLVTIKKNNKVYRHAYIKAGNTYTFNFPNGTYQTFFYYGKGWNPNKFMKNTSCGELKGGFVSNEVFGKDNPQNLNNQILSYELILQQNGNFSTKPSNKNEAF